MQKGFVFDVNKCTGCSACRIACIIENDLDAGLSWRDVGTFNPWRVHGIPVFHHSLACNHCVDAPCEKSCPANAYKKDPLTGAVCTPDEVWQMCDEMFEALSPWLPQFNGEGRRWNDIPQPNGGSLRAPRPAGTWRPPSLSGTEAQDDD